MCPGPWSENAAIVLLTAEIASPSSSEIGDRSGELSLWSLEMDAAVQFYCTFDRKIDDEP